MIVAFIFVWLEKKKCSNPDILLNLEKLNISDRLVLNGYTHHRVFHSHNEFAIGKCHVNGILMALNHSLVIAKED